jgi:hypothetical protein
MKVAGLSAEASSFSSSSFSSSSAVEMSDFQGLGTICLILKLPLGFLCFFYKQKN